MPNDQEGDLELVARVQAGDATAFNRLVEKYRERLLRMVNRAIQNRSEAEDIVQETFFKAYLAIEQFRGDSRFYTWLYRIGLNSTNNYLATQQRRLPSATEADISKLTTGSEPTLQLDTDTPEAVYESKQFALALNMAIDDLPPDFREALTLREIDGLSYDDISALTHSPIGTVRSRISRAREMISDKLNAHADRKTDIE